jgi:O-antigen/teichoic acid export membrane protein
MVDEVVQEKPIAPLEPKKRFSFSLRLLMIVVTLAAAGAAFAANYPIIAAFLAFAFLWELAPWVMQSAAMRLGQGKYRRMTLSISICFVLGCALWALVRGIGPAILGAWFGAFFTLVVWFSGFDSKKAD